MSKPTIVFLACLLLIGCSPKPAPQPVEAESRPVPRFQEITVTHDSWIKFEVVHITDTKTGAEYLACPGGILQIK